MILVLLNKFCESQDSILGLTICKTLAKEGHKMYVTTTSTGEELENERSKANAISNESGSILLFEPERENEEEPNKEWITTIQHKKHFSYLQLYDDVRIIIGTWPETAQTAVELKEELKNSRLILASSRIMDSAESLKQLICKADEFWSVGPDVYNHYKNVFENINPGLCDKHKEITLELYAPEEEKSSTCQNNNLPQQRLLVVPVLDESIECGSANEEEEEDKGNEKIMAEVADKVRRLQNSSNAIEDGFSPVLGLSVNQFQCYAGYDVISNFVL